MINFRTNFRSLLIVGLLFSFCFGGVAQDNLKIVGSDLVGDLLADRLVEISNSADFAISLKMNGSLLGKIKMQEGLADVALIVESMDDAVEVPDGMVKIPVGFWGIYWVVSKDNPIAGTTIDVLREVVEGALRGEAISWQLFEEEDVGQRDGLIFMSSNLLKRDAAYPIFLKYFLGNKPRSDLGSLGSRMESFNGLSESSLVLLSHFPDDSEVKLLAIATDSNAPGFTPSAENMYYGDYPLSTSFYLLVNNVEDERVRAFVAEFLSEKTMDLLKESGLIPAPENVRKQALLGVDLEF